MPNKRAAPRDTNGRCTKCGQHHQHCAAHNRRGTPCGIAPIRGANVCWRHGGAAPQTRAAARRHLAADEATRATRRLFEQYEIDPIADPVTAFQELAAEIRTFKDFLADRVADLEENITGRTGKKGHGREYLRAVLVEYRRALNDCGKFLETWIRLGMEERLTKVREEQARAIADAVVGALAELGHDDDHTRRTVARHLRVIDGGQTA